MSLQLNIPQIVNYVKQLLKNAWDTLTNISQNILIMLKLPVNNTTLTYTKLLLIALTLLILTEATRATLKVLRIFFLLLLFFSFTMIVKEAFLP